MIFIRKQFFLASILCISISIICQEAKDKEKIDPSCCLDIPKHQEQTLLDTSTELTLPGVFDGTLKKYEEQEDKLLDEKLPDILSLEVERIGSENCDTTEISELLSSNEVSLAKAFLIALRSRNIKLMKVLAENEAFEEGELETSKLYAQFLLLMEQHLNKQHGT